jgi:hypothetical protein
MAVVNVNVVKEPLVVPSQVVGVSKQNGKRIVKMFLSDSSINANGRAIPKDAQDAVMRTTINKPYIIPPFLDHPQRPRPYPVDQNEDIALIHKTAKPYEGGTVFDLERVNSEENPGYNAYVELTSMFAIKLFDEGLLPRFVSTSIYKLNPNESDSEMRSAVVNNICAVRHPAYGAKARVLGMCVGDREDCKTGLRDASESEQVEDNEKCATMKAVESLDTQDRFEFSNDLLKDLEQKSSNMSQTAGSTTSTTTTEFPRSGRKVVQDSAGNVISDTHAQKTEESKSIKSEANNDSDKEVTKKEETKTETKEETTKEKDAPIKSNEPPKKISEQEEQKKEDQKEDAIPPEEAKNTNNDSQVSTQLKQLSNEVARLRTDNRFYRNQIIEKAVNNATYLKPDQKEEHIAKWKESELNLSSLIWALDTSYSPQAQAIKQQDRDREKKSSQLHDDDTDSDSEKTSSSRPKKDNDGKLTLDLLTRH